MADGFDWERARSVIRDKVDAAASKAAVAQQAGMPVSTLQSILRGESVPSFDKMARLAPVLDLSLDDLAFGPPVIGGSVLSGMAQGLRRIQAHQRAQDAMLAERLVSVEDYDMVVSAGDGATLFEQQPIGWLAFNREWVNRRFGSKHHLAIVRVRGDSMEPELRDGDRVMIDRAQTAMADGLFVVTHEDQAKIKRVQVIGKGRLLLLSSNPAYQPEEVRPADPGVFFKVEGRAVWLGRNL